MSFKSNNSKTAISSRTSKTVSLREINKPYRPYKNHYTNADNSRKRNYADRKQEKERKFDNSFSKFDKFGNRLHRNSRYSTEGFKNFKDIVRPTHDLRAKIGYETKPRNFGRNLSLDKKFKCKFFKKEGWYRSDFDYGGKSKSNAGKRLRGMEFSLRKKNAENQILRKALDICTRSQGHNSFNNNACQYFVNPYQTFHSNQPGFNVCRW